MRQIENNPNLEIAISGFVFRNPFFIASGVLGHDTNRYILAWNSGVGGVITKTYTLEPREGYPPPIIVGTKCGYINAVGLANPGLQGMIETLQFVRNTDIVLIISIAGGTPHEFFKLGESAYNYGAKILELNFSCPHAKRLGLEVGMDPELVRKVIRYLKEEFDLIVIPKFGYFPKMSTIAKIAEMAGADAISAINTIRGMTIDIYMRKPVLSNRFGGISGPAIHPIAVATIYELYEILEDTPIIASGGVWDWRDAIEFFLAGATGVQIGSILGTENLDSVVNNMISETKKYLARERFNSITEIIGLAH